MVGQQHLFILCFTREHFSVLNNYSIGYILLVHLNACERKTEVTISMGVQSSQKKKRQMTLVATSVTQLNIISNSNFYGRIATLQTTNLKTLRI